MQLIRDTSTITTPSDIASNTTKIAPIDLKQLGFPASPDAAFLKQLHAAFLGLLEEYSDMVDKASDIWESAHLPVLCLLREWEKQQLPYKLKRHFVRIRRAIVFFWTKMTMLGESDEDQARIRKTLSRTNRVSVSGLVITETGMGLGYYYLAETHRYSGTPKAYVEWLYKCALMRSPELKVTVFESLTKYGHISGNATRRMIALQTLYLLKPTEQGEEAIIALTKTHNFKYDGLATARELLEHTIMTLLCGRSPLYILEALHICLHDSYLGSDELEERPSFAEIQHSTRTQYKLSHLLPSVLIVFAYKPGLDCLHSHTAIECINGLVELFGDAQFSVSESEKVAPGDLLFEELELASIPSFTNITELRKNLYEQIGCAWATLQRQDLTHDVSYDDFQRVQCIIYLAKTQLGHWSKE